MSPIGTSSNYSNISNTTGYITEKMYILLQLYLQNKSWNPSFELLQCFTELKETSMLPTPSHLQMLVTRIALNGQGRLILRENGKLIIPCEQFANAIMMKHLDGPHGSHLSPESTVRAIMENFTVGREFFGMEREFIVEIVQNCPSPACRYYDSPIEQSQKTGSVCIQDSESGTPTITRASFSQHSESVLGTSPIPTNMSGSLTEVDSRSSLRSQNHPTMLKRFTAKLHDPSSLVISTADSCKLSEFWRTSSDSIENINIHQSPKSSGKEPWSPQNGTWPMNDGIKSTQSSSICDGQDKIVRTFAEVMRNMSRMKACVRPAMCKPYGKQSEALQKTLIDTIQLIQSLRSFLPPPHIPVTSWKNEGKHGVESSMPFLACL